VPESYGQVACCNPDRSHDFDRQGAAVSSMYVSSLIIFIKFHALELARDHMHRCHEFIDQSIPYTACHVSRFGTIAVEMY
jgi:hypothetical protein